MEKLANGGSSSERRISKRLLQKKLMHDLNHVEESWECLPASSSFVCDFNSAQNLQEYDRENDESSRKQKGRKMGRVGKKAIKDDVLGDDRGMASSEKVAFSEGRDSARVSKKQSLRDISCHTIIHDANSAECADEPAMENRDTSRKHKRRKKSKSSKDNIANKDQITSNSESHTIVHNKNLAKHCEEHEAQKEDSSREHNKRNLERGVEKFIKNDVFNLKNGISSVEHTMASSGFADLLEPQADLEGLTVVRDTNASQHCEKHDMEKEDSLRKHTERKIARTGKRSIKHGIISNKKRFSSVEKIMAGPSISDLRDIEANFEGGSIVHDMNLTGRFEKHDMENEERLRNHIRRKMQRAGKKSMKVDVVGDKKDITSTGQITSSSSFANVLGTQADPKGQTIAYDMSLAQRCEERGIKNTDSSRKHNARKTTRADKKSMEVDINSNIKEITSAEQVMASSSFADLHGAPIEAEGGTIAHDMNSAQHIEEHGKEYQTSSRKHKRRNMEKAAKTSINFGLLCNQKGVTYSKANSDGHTIVHDMRRLEEHDAENEGSLKEHRRKKQRAGKYSIKDGNFDCKKGTTSIKQLSVGSFDAQLLEIESQGESGGCTIVRNTNLVQYHKEHGMEVEDRSRKHRRRNVESAARKSINDHVLDFKNMTTSVERATVSSSDANLLQTQADSEGHTIVQGTVSTQRIEEHDMEKDNSKKQKRRNVEGSFKKRIKENALNMKDGILFAKQVTTSSSFDCLLGTQADPGGGTNGYETISKQRLEKHKTKSKHSTRTRKRRNSERACKADIKGDATCNLKFLNSVGEVMANSAVSDLHVTQADVVGGSIFHDKNPVQHFEEHDMESVDTLRKRRKMKRAVKNATLGNEEGITSVDQRIESMSFSDLLGPQPGREGCTVVDDTIQDSVRMHKRRKRERVGKDSFKEDALSNKTGIATVSPLTASSFTDLVGQNTEVEGFTVVHGMNSTRHHKHVKEREGSSRKHKRSKIESVGELPPKDDDLGSKKGTSSREQVTLVVDQISSLTSVDLCQHVDFSQVSKPYTESLSGEASRLQCSDSEPCIRSPQGFCEYDYTSVSQEHSISNKLHYHSKSASLMESVTSDHHELDGKVCEKNAISAHKQTTVEARSYDNGGVSILENKGTMGAENSAIVSKLSNQDDVSHFTESVPFCLPLNSNEVPSTLLRVSDIDVDSVVVSKVNELFPTSLSTRAERFLELDTQENGRKYPDFVPISRDKSNHVEVASKLCTVAAPSSTEGVSVSNDSLRVDKDGLHPTEIPLFLEPAYVPSEVPSSGCQECDAGDGVSCTIHLQTSRVDAQHKTTSFRDLIFEDYAPSIEAFSSPYPENCHLDEGRDRENLDKSKIKGKKAKQASKLTEKLEQAQTQIGGEQKVSRKRKVREPCLGNSKETLEKGTKKMRGCIARKLTPYQRSLKRRKTEIMRRAKAWASEAGFLKVVDIRETNEEQQENHLIISEHRRDEFVKAMVEMCRNNPRLRTSFLCSVKSIVDLGLLQLPATELLTQRSSKEAEDVIKSWERFSNESSSLRTAYLDFFESVDKLHRAGPSIVSELSCLQAPWSCSLSATGEEGALDVQLPKM